VKRKQAFHRVLKREGTVKSVTPISYQYFPSTGILWEFMAWYHLNHKKFKDTNVVNRVLYLKVFEAVTGDVSSRDI